MNFKQLNEAFDKLARQFLNENLDQMKDMVQDDSIDSYDLYDKLITYTNDMWANGIDILIQDTGDEAIELDGQGDTTMLSASAGYATWSSDDELQLLADLVLEAGSDNDVERGILEFLKDKYNKLAQNRNTDESLHKPLEENEGKKYNPQPRPAFPGRDLGSLLQNAIADVVQDYYDTTGVIPTRQEVRNAIETFIQSLSSYEELQENESLGSINEGTNFKRVARYGEFDNGYVMHNWAKMSDEEAENKAKQMSIKNPDDIYYVAYDDIMDPSSDIRWIAGEPYNYSEVQMKNGKPFIKSVTEDRVKSTKNTKLKEDVFYDWKPNTSFAHIKKIYNDVKKRGYKYVNNEREEMQAAMKKVDAKGYTPEQRKQIRSWSEEIWRANRKNESLKESYDDVNSSNAFDVLYDMVELFGCEEMLDALAKAMGTSDLADNLTYICRQYDYDPNPDSVNESLTEEESEDARKFIRKFCNGQWSDDYVNLIIYAMGEVVMADYREDIEDACSEILKANYDNSWVVIKEKLSASDLFKYCYEEFYDDLSTICSNILNGQSVDRTISSYLSTGYNRDKFVQVVRDVISRIDFEDDFDLAAEIDSALIYDEDLWSVIEFYLDPNDIINRNEFDTYISFVNDVEDIMLEYYSTEDKNESLNEEESPKSISDNDNSYPLAFVPTTDVKGKDLTNTLCDVLNKAGIKNCCAKKRAGKYYITVICPSTELGTAKTIIENCGFFKEWLPLNRG